MQNKQDEEFFPQYYDLEDVFDDKIQPLLKTILNICTEYNIPMITSFQYKNEKDQVMLCSSVVLPVDRACSKLVVAAKHLAK